MIAINIFIEIYIRIFINIFINSLNNVSIRIFIGKYSSPFQGYSFTIFNAADLPAHQSEEKCIDTVQHFFAAAEILIQFDLFCQGIIRQVGIIFFHKDFGPCQTEPVYTLLDVTHHKPVVISVILPGNDLKQQFLDFVAVLIFIDQDLVIVAAQRPGRPSGNIGPVLLTLCQDLQGKMLEIYKVDQVPGLFFFQESLGKLQGKGRQGGNGSRGRLHSCQDPLRILPRRFLAETGYSFFFPIPEIFDEYSGCGVQMLILFSSDRRISFEIP